jgi:hypothetical protein
MGTINGDLQCYPASSVRDGKFRDTVQLLREQVTSPADGSVHWSLLVSSYPCRIPIF